MIEVAHNQNDDINARLTKNAYTLFKNMEEF